MEKPLAIIFFGSSGSGKGTQARLLKEYLEKRDGRSVLYLSTGQALRNFIKEDSSYTAEITGEIMDKGGLMPVFLPVWLWTNFLVDNFTGQEHMIMDGLARREIEAPVLDSALEFYGISNPVVFYLKTSREWSTERLIERGRADDHEKEIKSRLDWFEENTMPSIEYFKEHEKTTFFEINGEQKIDDVHKDIIKSFSNGKD